MHIIGSQSTRTAVWKGGEDAGGILLERGKWNFASATAKIQNVRNFQKERIQQSCSTIIAHPRQRKDTDGQGITAINSPMPSPGQGLAVL